MKNSENGSCTCIPVSACVFNVHIYLQQLLVDRRRTSVTIRLLWVHVYGTCMCYVKEMIWLKLPLQFNGHHLLKLPEKDIKAYVRTLLDILFT